MAYIVAHDDKFIYLSNGNKIFIPVGMDKYEFMDIIKKILEAAE